MLTGHRPDSRFDALWSLKMRLASTLRIALKNDMNPNSNRRWGIFLAVGAQLIWGCFPIYLDWLKEIPSRDIVVHRTIWSFLLLSVLMIVNRQYPLAMLPSGKSVSKAIRTRASLLACLAAAILIAINWLMFVWAANHDHKVDASLGYYICPQVMVVLGVVLMGERLSLAQWIAVGIVSLGVIFCAQSGTGQVWISLTIACSFGLYALCKKRIKLAALDSLTIETGLLSVPALLFFAYLIYQGGELFSSHRQTNALLIGLGVATIAPLALYAAALKHISLSLMGFYNSSAPPCN